MSTIENVTFTNGYASVHNKYMTSMVDGVAIPSESAYPTYMLDNTVAISAKDTSFITLG